MAIPVQPKAPGLGRGFYQNAIDVITLCSNLSLPASADADTGVISGTTAATIVSALTTQRNLL